MRVDLSVLIGVNNMRRRNQLIDEILRKAKNDPIFISDLLVEDELAEPLLYQLRQDKNRKYILHAYRDEWGNTPQPGDIIERQHKNPLKEGIGDEQIPIPTKTLNNWKRMGIYDEKRYIYENFVVDKRGCIMANANDVEYFLTNWGVHSISNMAISQHPDEHSTEPVDCPSGGKMHVWYWRYKEMTPEMYKRLPNLKKLAVEKRGIDPVVLPGDFTKDMSNEKMV